MFTQLLKAPSVSLPAARAFGQHNKKHIYKDGEKFANNFYYPRQPNHVDEPAIEPSKLFRVERIKPIKGNPFWEKRILKQLGVGDLVGPRISIVKNIPEINAMLWKVKHLVNIVPIRFPFGEPSANDIAHTHLKECGECVVTKEIGIDERRLLAAEDFSRRPERLDGETLRKDSRLKWLNHW